MAKEVCAWMGNVKKKATWMAPSNGKCF